MPLHACTTLTLKKVGCLFFFFTHVPNSTTTDPSPRYMVSHIACANCWLLGARAPVSMGCLNQLARNMAVSFSLMDRTFLDTAYPIALLLFRTCCLYLRPRGKGGKGEGGKGGRREDGGRKAGGRREGERREKGGRTGGGREEEEGVIKIPKRCQCQCYDSRI